MRRLGLLLCLVLVARAGDEPSILRVHDCADLKWDDTWWAVAVARVRAAAQGGDVELQENGVMVVTAPAVLQEQIARDLASVREAFGQLVTLVVRIVKVEGGLGVASVPAEKLDALLRERKAEDIGGPTLVCRNGQQSSLSAVRNVSYVSGFEIKLGQDGITADPVVDTLPDGITAKLRPFVAGEIVRVSADISVSEVADQMREIELPLPLPTPVKIQVPESTTRSVTKLVECPPGAYAVIDLGGGQVVLLRAMPVRADPTGPGGEEPQDPEEIPDR